MKAELEYKYDRLENVRTIYKTDYLTLDLEFVPPLQIYLIHAYYDKTKIKPSHLKEDVKTWKIIKQVLNGIGLEKIYSPGFNPKYLKLFGFKPTEVELLYENGDKVRLWVADR